LETFQIAEVTFKITQGHL